MSQREVRKWELEQMTVLELIRVMSNIDETDGTIPIQMEKARIIETILSFEFNQG